MRRSVDLFVLLQLLFDLAIDLFLFLRLIVGVTSRNAQPHVDKGHAVSKFDENDPLENPIDKSQQNVAISARFDVSPAFALALIQYGPNQFPAADSQSGTRR